MEECKEDENYVTKDNDDNVIEWIPFIRQLAIASGAWTYCFMFGMSFGAPTVIIAQIKRDTNSSFNLTVDMESWLSSMLGFCGVPCVFILTALAYLFGRKVTCILISLAAVLGFIVFYVSTTVQHLLISQAIHGPLAASQITTSLFISSEYLSPQYRGMCIATQLASMFWGIWVSNAIGTFAHWKNIGIFGLLCSVYSTLSVFIIWPESPYWLSIRGRLDECVKSHRWLKGTSESAEKELAHLTKQEKDRAYKSKSAVLFIKEHTVEFFRVIRLPEVYKAFAFCLLFMTMYHYSGKLVCTMYSIDIIKKITNSEDVAYIGMLILDGITVFGTYCGCILVKKFKRRTLLVAFSLISVISLYSMSLYLYFIHLAVIHENAYLTISLLTTFSLAVSIGILSVSTVTLGEFLPLKSRSACVCLLSFYGKATLAITLKITPYLFRTIQFHGTFLVFGILSSVCLFIVYKYLPETKDKTLIEISELLRGSNRRLNKEFMLLETSDDTV